MVTVTPPPIFDLPWRRDAQGYRVLRTVDKLRELARRRERSPRAAGTDPNTGRATRRMTDDWPNPWPAAGEWIDHWIGGALRGVEDPDAAPVEHPGRAPKTDDEQVLAASKHNRLQPLIPGGGLIWPESDEAALCYPLNGEDDDKRGPAEQLIATEGQTPEDCSDVLEFTGRYGLLWDDGPLTVEDFRAVRDNLAALAAANAEFRATIDRHDRQKYEAAALIEAREHARFAPRFTMELRTQPRHRGLVPQMVPKDLYSLIALQVTEAMYSDSVRWRLCDHCGCLFLAGTGTSRGGKAKFCATSCKNKHADQKRKRVPIAVHQEKLASYADEVCPYCPESDRRAKRNPNHCGRRSCIQKHYRANQKARAAGA